MDCERSLDENQSSLFIGQHLRSNKPAMEVFDNLMAYLLKSLNLIYGPHVF
jgi:hypothetical protein